MAEGWANEWIKNERIGLENRQGLRRRQASSDGIASTTRTHHHDGKFARPPQAMDPANEHQSEMEQAQPRSEEAEHDRRLSLFLDGLMVVSVALDESAIIAKDATSVRVETSTPNIQPCVTCEGEICPSSPKQRKSIKEKAVKAMAHDGVDISSRYPKTVHEILPLILDNIRLRNGRDECDYNLNNTPHLEATETNNRKWKGLISFVRMTRDLLEVTSRELGMAYAGVSRTGACNKAQDKTILARNLPIDDGASDSSVNEQVVDNLIVLCSCPDALKRQLSTLSKMTQDWDIDAPTNAAKSGEGDGAYLRVSHQIRYKVNEFMNKLKRGAIRVGGDGMTEDGTASYDETTLSCVNVVEDSGVQL